MQRARYATGEDLRKAEVVLLVVLVGLRGETERWR